MALANPLVITVASTGTQQLYSISYPFTNVPQISSIGSSVVVNFGSTATSTTSTSASVNLSTDVITLQPNIVFQLIAQTQISANQPSQLAFVNGSGATIGFAQPAGQTLVVTTSSASTQTVTLVASTVNGTPWLYPSQITNAQVTIQALAGWTE
jgi:hypothetical protein